MPVGGNSSIDRDSSKLVKYKFSQIWLKIIVKFYENCENFFQSWESLEKLNILSDLSCFVKINLK